MTDLHNELSQHRDRPAAPEDVYRLEHVSRLYGSGATEVRALGDVSLTVAQGEFVAIVGQSGSGKTTLLQLLGALDRPTSGTVELAGADLARMSERELSRLRRQTIGFVFQQFNLIPTLTALQNVEVALAPDLHGRAHLDARANEVLEAVGLTRRAGHLPSQLSGGEQQRVAIARALANRPRVLLADEPTGNLDSATGDEILSLLQRLSAEHGHTIVLVTHDRTLAESMPRTIELRDGAVITDDRDNGPLADISA